MYIRLFCLVISDDNDDDDDDDDDDNNNNNKVYFIFLQMDKELLRCVLDVDLLSQQFRKLDADGDG